MTYTRDMSLSIRENILRYIAESFKEIRSGVDGYATTWGPNVIRRPVAGDDLKRPSDTLEIIDSTEETKPFIHKVVEKKFQVILTFYHKMRGDEDKQASSVLNRILVDVQRQMYLNSYNQFGGMGLTADERASEFDVDGSGDSIIHGVSVWEIVYRHRADDPRKLKGE